MIRRITKRRGFFFPNEAFLVAKRALLATKRALFGKKDMSFGNPPHHGTENCRLLRNIDFFLLLWVERGVFGPKDDVLGVLWTECGGTDLKQRQGITTMDHRNKIQSLVLPTDDPGDAPDCITEYGPLPVNMAIYAINQPIFQNKGFPCSTSWV